MKIHHDEKTCQCLTCSAALAERSDVDPDGPPMSSQTLPIIVAQWARSTNDTVMIKIDRFKESVVIDIRAWWTSPSGDLRAGRSGITMSVRHLPSLARALSKAEATAHQLGLLSKTADPEGF